MIRSGRTPAPPLYETPVPLPSATVPVETATPAVSATPVASATPQPTVTPVPTATPAPLLIGASQEAPLELMALLRDWVHDLGAVEVAGVPRRLQVVSVMGNAEAGLHVERLDEALAAVEAGQAALLTQRFHAAVVPFATVRDAVSMDEIAALWRGQGQGTLLVAESSFAELTWLWGAPAIDPVADSDLEAALAETPEALGLLPFDMLDPTYKVLTIDGQNVLSNQLDPAAYPLALAITLRGERAGEVLPHLQPLFADATNRDADQLTQLIMTGVTAMCRLTAERMERNGVLYPALMISDTLRAADITHISNEVPFIEGCQVDISPNNLTFCSDYDYWQALEAVGTDIVGLSGNHVNDFGYDGARESLAFYRQRDIPIYGSGLDVEEACAPILWEDHGNSLAFIATLAWNPASAWATDELPGTCYFYDHKQRLIDEIVSLKAQGVDVVAIELQYLETYNAFPTAQQVDEFRELYLAGADIVTGVQSHVPQAWEPYAADGARRPGLIVYGLGNLFFDQMWSWETRTGLIARHAIHKGRLISSEVLTTVLEDAAQPRWATADERAEILTRIFEAAPARP